MHPLMHRLEVVDRLAALDLDDAGQLLAVREDEVRKKRDHADLHGREVFIPHIGDHFPLPLVLGQEVADQTVVLELLTDGPNENRGHAASAD